MSLKFQRTLRIATKCRINQEIKFLCIKKLQLNERLFKLHLECANRWCNLQSTTLQTSDNKLTHQTDAHYYNLNHKLDTLQNKQQGRTHNNLKSQQFHTKTVNLNNFAVNKYLRTVASCWIFINTVTQTLLLSEVDFSCVSDLQHICTFCIMEQDPLSVI